MPLPAHTHPAAGLQAPVIVFLNVDGRAVQRIGAAAARRRIEEAFARSGVSAELVPVDGKALPAAIRARLANRPPGGATIVAAGGDGTVHAVAQALAGTDTPLGILPLGTLNHFARDLGLPLDLDEAVRVIAGGHAVAIDVGEVNGTVFVNNSSIGLYPVMVHDRNRQRRTSRRSKVLAMLLALFHVLRRPPVRRLRIEALGHSEPIATPLAFIGNNLYGTDLLSLGRRTSLAGGELCLFTANPVGLLGLVRLLIRAAFGRLDQARDFTRRSLAELTIHSRRRRLRVSLDGELARLRPPLRYRIRQRGLRVLVPLPATPP
jgi:diacylglycerol kinase family enzyme